jgi:small subunit ribosomal protein S8
LKIQLKYSSIGEPSFNNISFISKPGNPVFFSYHSICKMSSGLGIFLISTKEGLLTDQECIRKKLGGTGICYII